MVEAIINLLGGSIIGVVGGWVTTWMTNKRRKDDQAHELAVMESNRETRKVEATLQMEITKEEFSGKSFLTAQEAGNKTALSSAALKVMLEGNVFMRFIGTILAFLLGLTDVARSALRPAITIFLCWVCTMIVIQYMGEVGGLGIDERIKIVSNAVQSMFQLLNVCVSYWFGYRMTTKLMEK